MEMISSIHKAVVTPTMTYIAETRPDTSKTKQFQETTEVNILLRIFFYVESVCSSVNFNFKKR